MCTTIAKYLDTPKDDVKERAVKDGRAEGGVVNLGGREKV